MSAASPRAVASFEPGARMRATIRAMVRSRSGEAGGGEGAVEAQLAQRCEHCGDVAVGARAGDIEGGGEVGDGGAAFEQDSQSFDHHGRPLRQVGEGAFTDLAGLAIGFAQQDGGRGVSVGDGLDVHGY